MNHADLVQLAVKYLSRQLDARYILAEPHTKRGERPDAIGWTSDDITLIECKASRSDWLADRAKPSRAFGGIGTYRYALCKPGIIGPYELYPNWGLLTVLDDGTVALSIEPSRSVCNWKAVARLYASQARGAPDRNRKKWQAEIEALMEIGQPAMAKEFIRDKDSRRQFIKAARAGIPGVRCVPPFHYEAE